MTRTIEEIKKESEETDARYWALAKGRGRKSKSIKKRMEELARKSYDLWKELKDLTCEEIHKGKQ